MSTNIDISILLSYLRTTSNIALACHGFAWKVRSNGFSIQTSKGELCLGNLQFFKLLDYPDLDEWMRSEVFDAARHDKNDYLELLLERGADVEARDKDLGRTALIYAAWEGNTDCLRVLLAYRANMEVKPKDGDMALIKAAWAGNTDCLSLLLERAADIEARNTTGSSAISHAAYNGKIDCLRLLLQNKANIESKNKWGNTALIQASVAGKTDCLRLLLEHGAKVDPGMRVIYPQYEYLWENSTL